ncbi:MAG TPA: ACP phosphodiesterase [Flavobacteriales bacterium]|nr:ACP phosphodiesterase [Flavobacteriales bacterium]
MNFLAHVQLSHGIDQVITGNLVADAYKGKKYLDLPAGIQHGVILHRHIDHVTDTFEPVRQMKRILSPYFGRYAGVALDVYFDHMLSINWNLFYTTELAVEVENSHKALRANFHLVSAQSREFLDRLIHYNWLNSYRQKNDLERIFNQMAQRFGLNSLKNSIMPLEKHFDQVNDTFMDLYPALISKSIDYVQKAGL